MNLNEPFHYVGNDISDGYHTFQELYDHRNMLMISLMKALKDNDRFDVFFSHFHEDGTSVDGYVLAGIIHARSGTQMTYHIPEKLVPALRTFLEEEPVAPIVYDGHDADDVFSALLFHVVNEMD